MNHYLQYVFRNLQIPSPNWLIIAKVYFACSFTPFLFLFAPLVPFAFSCVIFYFLHFFASKLDMGPKGLDIT